MTAESRPRRIAKRILAPLLSDRMYSRAQAVGMAWDIRTGQWTEAEIGLLPHAVHRGETVLDIGANYGLYAYHLSRLVGGRGRVICFEPVPFTAMTFARVGRLLRFKHIELHEKGCGDVAGAVTFRIPVTASGAMSAGVAHLASRNNAKDYPFAMSREVICDMVVLDEYLSYEGDVSFIKCDIEGAELFALRGAKALLEHHRPTILCEIDPVFLEGFGLDVKDITSFLKTRGYRPYKWQAGRLVEWSGRPITKGNWAFIHPARAARFASVLIVPEAGVLL